MTPRRAKTIVAGVWIVSFLICLPPLLPQWKPASLDEVSHLNSASASDLSWRRESTANTNLPPAMASIASEPANFARVRVRRQIEPAEYEMRVVEPAEIKFAYNLAKRRHSWPDKGQFRPLSGGQVFVEPQIDRQLDNSIKPSLPNKRAPMEDEHRVKSGRIDAALTTTGKWEMT